MPWGSDFYVFLENFVPFSQTDSKKELPPPRIVALLLRIGFQTLFWQALQPIGNTNKSAIAQMKNLVVLAPPKTIQNKNMILSQAL